MADVKKYDDIKAIKNPLLRQNFSFEEISGMSFIVPAGPKEQEPEVYGTKRDGEIPPLGEKKQVVGDKPQETAFTDIPLELSDSKENPQESKIPQPLTLSSKPEEPQSFGFRSFLPSFVPLLKPSSFSNGLSQGNTTNENAPTVDSLSKTNRLEILEPELVPPSPRPLNTSTGGDESKSYFIRPSSTTKEHVINSVSSPQVSTLSPPPISSRPPPISNVGHSAISGNPYKLKSVNYSHANTPIKSLGGTPLPKSESPDGSIPLYGLPSAQTPSPNSFSILSGPQVAPKLAPNQLITNTIDKSDSDQFQVHNFIKDGNNSVSKTIDSSQPPLFQSPSFLNEPKYNLHHATSSVPAFQVFNPVNNTNITDSVTSVYNPNNFSGVDNTVCVSSITTVLTSAGPAPSSCVNQEQQDLVPISQSLPAPNISQLINCASIPGIPPLAQPLSIPPKASTAESPNFPVESKSPAVPAQPGYITYFPGIPTSSEPILVPPIATFSEAPNLCGESKMPAHLSQPTNVAPFPEIPPVGQQVLAPPVGRSAEASNLPGESNTQADLSQPTNIASFPKIPPVVQPVLTPPAGRFAEAPKLPVESKLPAASAQPAYTTYFPGIPPSSEPILVSSIAGFSEAPNLSGESKTPVDLSQPTNIASLPEIPPVTPPISTPIIPRFSEAPNLPGESEAPEDHSQPTDIASFPGIPPVSQPTPIPLIARFSEAPKLPGISKAPDHSQPTDIVPFPEMLPVAPPTSIPLIPRFSEAPKLPGISTAPDHSQPTGIAPFPEMLPVAPPTSIPLIPRFSEASKSPCVSKARDHSEPSNIASFPGIPPVSQPTPIPLIARFSEASKLPDESKTPAVLSQPTCTAYFPGIPPVSEPLQSSPMARFSEAPNLPGKTNTPGDLSQPKNISSFPEIAPLEQPTVGIFTKEACLPAPDHSQPMNNASFPAPVPTFNYFSSLGSCFPPALDPTTNNSGKTELPSSSFFKPIESPKSVCNPVQPLQSLEKRGPVFVNPVPSLPPKVSFPPPNISLPSKIILPNPPKSQPEASCSHENESVGQLDLEELDQIPLEGSAIPLYNPDYINRKKKIDTQDWSNSYRLKKGERKVTYARAPEVSVSENKPFPPLSSSLSPPTAGLPPTVGLPPPTSSLPHPPTTGLPPPTGSLPPPTSGLPPTGSHTSTSPTFRLDSMAEGMSSAQNRRGSQPRTPSVSSPILEPYYANIIHAPSYRPPYHHWFFKSGRHSKSPWTPFSMADSLNLEQVFTSSELNEETKVATDGGRYDVQLLSRSKTSVYWEEPAGEVRRCSWFVKSPSESRYTPYDENIAALLEDEYKLGCETNEWNRRIELADGEVIILHSASAMAHHVRSSSPEAWSSQPSMQQKPRVVKRGVEDFDIAKGEPKQVDHLLLVVHGVGKACDLRFRSLMEVVDDFRSISLQLVQSHFHSGVQDGNVGRVEILPVEWHGALHTETINDRLSAITLPSIPRAREFTNETLLDILFYTSPVFCEKIVSAVGVELNRVYTLYKTRNPGFRGQVSLSGHSLGSLILFDILCHQQPVKRHHLSTQASLADEEDETVEELGCLAQSQRSRARLSRRMSYLTIGPGTGQPYTIYPQLLFQPKSFFALGSPIGMFVTVRGLETLGEEFKFPTCPAFFNIFHPNDPVAYRIEALIKPEMASIPAVLIPHHKGRKRMHLELKETMAHVTAALKQKLVDSMKNTWNTVYQLALFSRKDNALTGEVNKVIEDEVLRDGYLESDPPIGVVGEESSGHDVKVGKLNGGRRVDYVLQEAPLETFNQYISAIRSHLVYWESEDTVLMILKEIYGLMGIEPDTQVPQPILPFDVGGESDTYSEYTYSIGATPTQFVRK